MIWAWYFTTARTPFLLADNKKALENIYIGIDNLDIALVDLLGMSNALICVSKLTIVGSDNGLSPDRRQAIIGSNSGRLLIWTLGKNFREILFEIHTYPFKKMYLKLSLSKWRLFRFSLNVLKLGFTETSRYHRNWHNAKLTLRTHFIEIQSNTIAVINENIVENVICRILSIVFRLWVFDWFISKLNQNKLVKLFPWINSLYKCFDRHASI